MEKYKHPLPGTNKVDDLFLNSINSYEFTHTDEPPTKENSLYLTITQQWFDEIISGRKEIEYREVKKSTMSRFLQLPKKKSDPYFIHDDLPEDAPIGIYEYNDGIFCFVPKEYKYLNLAVGYNKNRDTATIRLKGACFMPTRMRDDRILRYKFDTNIEPNENLSQEEYDEMIYDAEGDGTIWIIGYELGEVVELNRK